MPEAAELGAGTVELTNTDGQSDTVALFVVISGKKGLKSWKPFALGI